MVAVYYILFACLLVLVSPLLLVKKKARAGLKQKLGFIPPGVSEKRDRDRPLIWFHAVSVGEFNAVAPLLKRFGELHPRYQIAVSTTTETGQALATQKLADRAIVFYFPFDTEAAAGAWLEALSPACVVIAETEIWPGFTWQCKKRGVKLVVVNGRISPKSFKGYKRWRFFFGRVLSDIAVIGVQNKDEEQRYLGIAPDARVEILGNLKFDGLKPISQEGKKRLAEDLRLSEGELVVVGGSTHPGEESALLDAYKETRVPGKYRLILVPRHPERFDQVAKLIADYGLRARRFSKGENFEREGDVYLLDVIGKLFDFYSLAKVAFVGGTIAPVGGHSIMEPYAYSVPVVVGPHIEKTRDIARELTEAGALTMVNRPDELADALDQMLEGENLRTDRGSRGNAILLASQGAVEKAVSMIAAELT